VPAYRNATLKCLTEIGSLNVVDSYDPQLVFLFHHTMIDIANFMPLDRTNIMLAYNGGSHEEQTFLQNLTLFICGFLKEHLHLIETQYKADKKALESGNRSGLELAHLFLLKLSEIEEREIFKICLEYWIKLVSDLYHENPFGSVNTHPLSFGGAIPGSHWRRLFYAPILSQLRVVMINRMVKPEEVLIVENDEGEIVKEVMKDTDAIILYKSIKECLVYLTHLDNEDTENIMVDKLRKQVDGSEWSWNNLNKLCWAIGSISGAMRKYLIEEHVLSGKGGGGRGNAHCRCRVRERLSSRDTGLTLNFFFFAFSR
jgi:exportin-1